MQGEYANSSAYYYYSQYIGGSAIVTVFTSPTISNCIIKNVNYGISCYQASKPIISNDTLINVTYTPFALSGSADPVFTGNAFINPGLSALGLIGGNVSINGTIKKRNVAGFNNITYVLLSDLTINNGTYLSVDSGVVIKMQGNIFVQGGFKTNGTATSKVTFTSINDDNVGNPGDTNGNGNATYPNNADWGGIAFDGGSDDTYNNIKNSNLKYGGQNFYDNSCNCYSNGGNVRFINSNGKITNSVISNSVIGISCEGNAAPVIDSLTIQNCSNDPIGMSLTSNPSFANITFIANSSQGIRILEGTLASNATLTKRSLAGISNISYLVYDLNISSNATLTIEPGVVIKFPYYYGYITVNGTLIAQGTASDKIIFTSFSDDSRGGDANNNGSATSPNKGDFGGIQFYNSNAGSILRNCEISYGGNAGNYSSIDIENTSVTIDSCLIQQSLDYGVAVIGSANPVISNSQFFNITYSPVYISMFSIRFPEHYCAKCWPDGPFHCT